MLCFKECGRVEVIFRGTISETLSSIYGPHPYFDDRAFDKDNRIHGIRCLSDIFYKNLPSDPRAKHYFSTYNPPMLPPIWVIKDFMTFGSANHFFGTLSKANKDKIAQNMNVFNAEILQSWIKALIDLRNICAHHDRLFNKSFQKQPTRIKKFNVPIATTPNRLYSLLECMQHFIRVHEPGFDIFVPFRALVAATPAVRPAELGF
jgi:abortive infection bacteriophage resistance protein